ncbi:MAG: tungstate transporter permease, partial [Candidatus Thermoplasmatota archaeon]|nr:tungstate transporter permease [Candidatus Thermoplasmatota archaeon]
VLSEARIAIVSAVMVGFGRAIAEVGAVMIVGGNIKWHTRVLTTSIVLETRQGNFEYAMVLGAILLTVAATVFIVLQYDQEDDRR